MSENNADKIGKSLGVVRGLIAELEIILEKAKFIETELSEIEWTIN